MNALYKLRADELDQRFLDSLKSQFRGREIEIAVSEVADSTELADSSRQITRPQRTAAEKLAARERFERHFGEIDLGFPTGVDNERIDADLAREYSDPHVET